MRLRPWILLASLLPAAAQAEDDWLTGEYEVVVPDRPTPKRFVLVITRDADGRYRDEVFKQTGEASAASRVPLDASERGAIRGVRELGADEMAKMAADNPSLARANVRCAEVDGLMLCRIPDGATIDLEGRTVGAGYFAAGMHVGEIAVHRRLSGAERPVASAVRTGHR